MTVQDTIEQVWAAFEGDDLDTLRTLLADDVEMVMPDVTVRGVDALLGMLAAYKAAFPDLHHELVDGFETGDRGLFELVVSGTNTGGMTTPDGTLPPTGRSVRSRSADVVTTRNGKVTGWRVYPDTARLAAALGTAPEPEALAAARAVAQRVSDTVERGDLEAFVDCFAVDAVLDHPMLGRLVGRDGIRQAEGALFTAFTNVKFDVRSVNVGPDGWATVEIIGTAVNTGTLQLPDGTEVPPTGRTMRLPMIAVIRLDGEGRMAEHRRYFDTAILLQALGLAPEPAAAGA